MRENKITYKIGQEIEIIQGFIMEKSISKSTVKVKKGDKGIITSDGVVKYITGEARDMFQKLSGDIEIKGYDYENIAEMIYTRLNNAFLIEPILEDGGYEIESVLEEIEDVLMDIL